MTQADSSISLRAVATEVPQRRGQRAAGSGVAAVMALLQHGLELLEERAASTHRVKGKEIHGTSSRSPAL